MTTFASIIQPSRGFRGTDAYGSGVFGASRDGGSRLHKGRDFVAVPGDTVHSPIDGVVKRLPIAYPNADLMGVEIENDKMRVKLLYLDPSVAIGSEVAAGDSIGVAQDVSAYYAKISPRAGHMVNHVHVEIMVWVDAEDLVKSPELSVVS